LFGGDGDDRLIGGDGRNELEGGIGRDTFVLGQYGHVNRIKDFETGSDLIEVLNGSYDDAVFSQIGKDVRVTWGNSKVFLEGIDMASISRDDFVEVESEEVFI
ncbi:MAG: hypothetical protein AAF668_15560, partial [Pseudomonadota bacterium]